ncbi:ATP-binding protein [Ruthenibacterium lactatiformans]|uniref:ATP-binding protein n=1 Tax=Ruthenibacterium lactatiformans TaxID=1550024 RepID=UPI0026DD2D88|nr:ATP-binding protein [Ruthenibacterium lactatiformans]
MSELTVDRLRENLESLKMKNTLEILDNYLERAVADKLNIVEVLDYIFSEEAKFKRKRAYEKQVQVSGFPIKKTLDDFDFSFQPSIDKRQIVEFAAMRFLESGENVVFLGPPGVGKTHLASALGLVAAQHRFSTYYINCHQLIEQLKKASFENRPPDKLKILAKYRMLIIDEIGYLFPQPYRISLKPDVSPDDSSGGPASSSASSGISSSGAPSSGCSSAPGAAPDSGTSSSGGNGPSAVNVPQTGDYAPLFLLSLAAILCAGMLILLLHLKRRAPNEKK